MKTFLFNRRNRLVAALMILLLLNAILIFFSFNEENTHYEKEMKSISDIDMEVQLMGISMIYDMLHVAANEKASTLANKIVTDIHVEYPDINQLRDLLDNEGLENTKIPHIVYKNIVSNNMLGMHNAKSEAFVLISDGYIMNGDYTSFNRTWHRFNEEKLFDAKYLYDYLESREYYYIHHILYFRPLPERSDYLNTLVTESDINDIKLNIRRNGLEAFYGLTFFGISYITVDGDIFGNKDVSDKSVRVPTHKMIVIQPFSMKDILDVYYTSYLNNAKLQNALLKENTVRSHIIKQFELLICLVLNIGAMIISSFVMTRLNRTDRKS
jgi:hypothetical protein